LIISILFISIASLSYGQNAKKTYRLLKRGEIEKAKLEIIESEKETISAVDSKLLKIGMSIITNNKKSDNYDAYAALEIFSKVIIPPAYNSEITEFLENYDFNLEEIRRSIYENIFLDAQILNTENAYEMALKVCNYCFYFAEAKKLVELSAFNYAV